MAHKDLFLNIASYKALIAAGRDFGDTETVGICESILRDEEEMAIWLDQNLPMIVRVTFAKRAGEHGRQQAA